MAYVVIEWEINGCEETICSVRGPYDLESEARAYAQEMNNLHNDSGYSYSVMPLLSGSLF